MNILHKCLLIKSIKVDKNDLRNNFPKWYQKLENQSIFDLFLFSWNIVKLFINWILLKSATLNFLAIFNKSFFNILK